MLRVTGYGLRVAGYGLRGHRYIQAQINPDDTDKKIKINDRYTVYGIGCTVKK